MPQIPVGGPFFEDFKIGQVFDDAPAVTLTSGMTAVYQSLFGDRLRLALDGECSAAVTKRPEMLVHPMLVCHVAIGQSTEPSQRVRGNLFYRNLVLLSPVHVGDTLRTTTEVVGLKENRKQPGKPATGLVALRVRTHNQRREPVLDFWRCPMIPLRDHDAVTGHRDSFDDIPSAIDSQRLLAATSTWDVGAFVERSPASAQRFADLAIGTTYVVEGRDTVTCAPELVRLTLNLAAAHTDAAASPYGRRLVYGGHVISIAHAQIVRALPGLITMLAWTSCEHVGPVFEGDVLRTEVGVESLEETGDGAGRVGLRAIVFASREDANDVPVLDWRLIGLM